MAYIKDGPVFFSTGVPAARTQEAEYALRVYLDEAARTDRAIVDPRSVRVSEVVAHYRTATRPPECASRNEILFHRNQCTRLANIERFFAGATLRELVGRAPAYETWRMKQRHGRQRDDTEADRVRRASLATARMDLACLAVALDLYRDAYSLAWVPAVRRPKPRGFRVRFLTRGDVARIVWAIRGRVWDPRTGDWERVPADAPAGLSVAPLRLRSRRTRLRRRALWRFLMIGLFTGTRHAAILRLGWERRNDRGNLDVERGLVHRSGLHEERTNKRQPPSILPKRLLAHARRWRRLDRMTGAHHVVHKPDGGGFEYFVRNLWLETIADAGLPPSVVPHLLRHTAVTWALQAGATIQSASDLLGMSEQTLLLYYQHWSLEGQANAAAALDDTRRIKELERQARQDHGEEVGEPSAVEPGSRPRRRASPARAGSVPARRPHAAPVPRRRAARR